MTFVDTSAIYALLDRNDVHHHDAAPIWRRLLSQKEKLITSNYVLVECCALAQHRLGIAAVRAIYNDILPVLEVQWMDATLHAIAIGSLLTADRKKLSLVDCASFAIMRQAGARKAFAFDGHFDEQGFAAA